MKLLSCILSVVFLGNFSRAQEVRQPIVTIEFIQTSDGKGNVTCSQVDHAVNVSEEMSSSAAGSGLHILKETVGRKNNAVGLDIVLRGTAQLEANAAAKQAFINAAARWENIILSPVKVIIDVDYGLTRFGTPFSGSNVLGSTSTPTQTATTIQGGTGSLVGFRRFADSLKSRNPGYADLYDAIPDTLPNTAGSFLNPASGISNLQALGFLAPFPSDSIPFGQAAAIGFNSAFTFDLDPSNGITGGQTDFDAVAVHEMGHALGFLCRIGSSTSSLYVWDIFRFRPGAVTDLTSFKTAQRVNTPGPSSTGGDQIFWDGFREWEVSTATGSRTGGDGQQASHWRNDASRGAFPVDERYIGIMDPDIAAGVRQVMTVADKKALSVMGWKLDFGNLIGPPSIFAVSSDYHTPKSVALSWRNPNSFYGGAALSNWKMILFRNGVVAHEFTSPVAGATVAYVDSNLTAYSSLLYRLVPFYITTNDSGLAVSQSVIVGGSPTPAIAPSGTIAGNSSTVVMKFSSPTRHTDGTILNDLRGYRIYRNNTDAANLLDSLQLAPADTGKSFTYVNTPPPKGLVPIYAYFVSFYSSALVSPESGPFAFPTLTAGKISTATYTENFETNRQSVVADGLWDSTNVAAHAGTFALGALAYPNNSNFSAYIPEVKGNGSPTLSFWTICRTEASQDFGLVEVSRNRGQSWSTVLTLNETTHPEWQAGTNVWFQKNIALTGYSTDTILVRFRLTSNGSVSKFGWLIDDIVLSPVATGVTTERLGIPTEYSLEQNYPNPFNPSTQITYALKERGAVSLVVYDVLGRATKEVVHSVQDAGWYSLRFDASPLSSGIYYYELRTNGYVAVKKMVLLR